MSGAAGASPPRPPGGLRLLFSFVGGQGHLEPLVPLARAARAAGHAVAFGCAPEMLPAVAAAGFPGHALGVEAGRPARRLPLRRPDRAREERDLRERFVRRAARYRVPLVAALCDAWRPDVLVCDETDFGAMLAAERRGLPFASVLVIAAGGFVRPDVVGEALDALRAEHGLAPDPGLGMLRRFLVLAPFPPGFRDPADPLPATAYAFRPPWRVPGGHPAPAWSTRRPGAARVYLTLGTVFNRESGDLLERVLRGLRELPVNLLVTLGPGVEPRELGPQPDHVRLERYVPQAEVLPHCDLVVSHGGSGSVIGALAHGLPSLLLPLGADQPLNAARCAALGVAEVLDPMEVTPAGVRAAASRVIATPAWRRRAEDWRDAIAALPAPEQAVVLLERLAAERRPLRRT